MAVLVVAKTIDELGRKLEFWRSRWALNWARRWGRAEEMMELGTAIILVQAVICSAPDRGGARWLR